MERIIENIKFKINKISKKWDIYVEEKEKKEAIINDSKVEKLRKGKISGVAIRIFKKNKMAFVYSDIDENKSLNRILNKINDLIYIEGYENHKFYSNENINEKIKIFNDKQNDIEFKRRLKILKELEKYTKKINKKIKTVKDIGYNEDRITIKYLNSEGFEKSYSKTVSYIYLSAIASENKEEEIVDGIKTGIFIEEKDFFSISEKTAKRASDLLKGKSIKSGYYDILLPNFVCSELVGFLAQLFYAENIRKKKSLFFINKSGEKIVDEKITIKDDALLDFKIGSYPFDGEGNPGKNKFIIKQGILNDFIYDNLNAVIFNKEPTGNSNRENYQKLPSCFPSNFYITPGEINMDKIIKNFTGIKINSLMGLHTIDTVSGNFSLGANGWYFKNGKIKTPVKEILLTGNLKDFLNNVEYVCDDLEFYFNYGAPSLFIKNILISGKE